MSSLPDGRTAPSLTPERASALHRQAVWTMLLCTVLWSLAGVGTRLVEQAEGFELAFWRALACSLFVGATLLVRHRSGWWRSITSGGLPVLASGALWAVMFTFFMVALARTTVANVLVVMAAAPLLAALLGLLLLREPVLTRTWAAIAIAGVGIVWMVREGLSADGIDGMMIAAAVPVASALNIVLLKRIGTKVDLVPAVLVGSLIACLGTLPFAWPLSVSAQDLAILSALGIVQLAVPCMLMVRAAHHLAPHEIALLGLLEVVLGPLWTWVGAGETPGPATLQGGVLVLGALVLNEVVGTRGRRA